jgi:hypothetical protein
LRVFPAGQLGQTAVYALPATSILALTLKIKPHCHRHRLVRKTVRT